MRPEDTQGIDDTHETEAKAEDYRAAGSEPAYPSQWGEHGQIENWPGAVTLRDYFAVQAMSLWLRTGHCDDEAAKRAYEYADAMLRARAV